ncbi:protein rep, partial [Mammaliicoccus sp. L-M43]|uniref:protein rep n=1 Tax=Mammaliicoccus sp. L-M43 TaxID=2898702 RepID=UPI0035AF57AE
MLKLYYKFNFATEPFKPTEEGYLKLYKTWFCKSKLCPVCNWRRAMKNSYQAQRVIEE